MAYEPLLSPQAQHDLTRLPDSLREHVLAEIERLAADPVHLSRPAVFPWLPNRQLFRAEPVQEGDDRHEFHVFFHYGQDEQTLHVIAIGHYKLG